ncbi:MAG: YPDG domain-containing protein, partial [Dermabacter sp.]|nr:YPDG domain-containing protein [Dermabacter sp.]
IDENTGEITVTFPDGSKLNKDTVEEFDVPVTVTYPDETTDEVKANFKLDTDGDKTPDTTDEDDDNDGIPDKEEKDKGSNPKDKGSIPATPIEPGNHTNAATYEPGYEDGSGKPGSDVKIDAPKFTDKDGKDTKAPEGTKFTPGENAPDGVKVDEKTGEITVPIPEDAKPGTKITVPVDVTYPDGSKDHVDVTVTVDEPDAPAEKPDWNDDKGKPGDKVEIPNTGGPVEDGTTVETEGPGKAEIGEDGKIIVDIDKDAKPGDKVVVIVKDKDGNEIDRVVVEVEKPADKPAEKPDWKDNSGKPGDNVVIPNDGGPVPDGSTVETEGPGKAEIDKDGNIRVDIDKDAKPGDKVVVIVKDKDGKVIDTVTVTVEKPEAPAEQPAPGGNDNGTAPKPGASNGKAPVKKVPLPRTGAEVAGVAGAAAALIAAGLGLVFSRRRRTGEEN